MVGFHQYLSLFTKQQTLPQYITLFRLATFFFFFVQLNLPVSSFHYSCPVETNVTITYLIFHYTNTILCLLWSAKQILFVLLACYLLWTNHSNLDVLIAVLFLLVCLSCVQIREYLCMLCCNVQYSIVICSWLSLLLHSFIHCSVTVCS